MRQRQPSFACSLLSGGVAGTTVDVALFPLDTIKTRMQSPAGLRGAGSFRGVYSGLASAAAGSAPTAALFFTTYETAKAELAARTGGGSEAMDSPAIHMAAASMGEASACLIRVPTENVKQKMQVGLYATTGACVRGIVAQDGPRGFMRGYSATFAREMPFAAIQFPIYEGLKRLWGRQKGAAVESAEAAACGSIAVRATLCCRNAIHSAAVALRQGTADANRCACALGRCGACRHLHTGRIRRPGHVPAGRHEDAANARDRCGRQTLQRHAANDGADLPNRGPRRTDERSLGACALDVTRRLSIPRLLRAGQDDPDWSRLRGRTHNVKNHK
jgi:hypothetical protein